jgi:hypothetical protein
MRFLLYEFIALEAVLIWYTQKPEVSLRYESRVSIQWRANSTIQTVLKLEESTRLFTNSDMWTSNASVFEISPIIAEMHIMVQCSGHLDNVEINQNYSKNEWPSFLRYDTGRIENDTSDDFIGACVFEN